MSLPIRPLCVLRAPCLGARIAAERGLLLSAHNRLVLISLGFLRKRPHHWTRGIISRHRLTNAERWRRCLGCGRVFIPSPGSVVRHTPQRVCTCRCTAARPARSCVRKREVWLHPGMAVFFLYSFSVDRRRHRLSDNCCCGVFVNHMQQGYLCSP